VRHQVSEVAASKFQLSIIIIINNNPNGFGKGTQILGLVVNFLTDSGHEN
jgi:hypothetical protein